MTDFSFNYCFFIFYKTQQKLIENTFFYEEPRRTLNQMFYKIINDILIRDICFNKTELGNKNQIRVGHR